MGETVDGFNCQTGGIREFKNHLQWQDNRQADDSGLHDTECQRQEISGSAKVFSEGSNYMEAYTLNNICYTI